MPAIDTALLSTAESRSCTLIVLIKARYSEMHKGFALRFLGTGWALSLLEDGGIERVGAR